MFYDHFSACSLLAKLGRPTVWEQVTQSPATFSFWAHGRRISLKRVRATHSRARTEVRARAQKRKRLKQTGVLQC